ncbi:hypothetical protein D9M69_663710 [compost metagenome]
MPAEAQIDFEVVGDTILLVTLFCQGGGGLDTKLRGDGIDLLRIEQMQERRQSANKVALDVACEHTHGREYTRSAREEDARDA